MRLVRSLLTILWVGPVLLASARTAQAQAPGFVPSVFLGLSGQTDVRANEGVPDPGHFRISPIGLVGGFALHRESALGDLSLRAQGAWYPLVMHGIVTGGPVGEANPKDPPSLVVAGLMVGWEASLASRRTWSPIAGIGLNRAVDTPRRGDRSAIVGSVGVSHRVSTHANLRASLDASIPVIGKTFLQIPIVVALHR